jgi:hypothetical protein
LDFEQEFGQLLAEQKSIGHWTVLREPAAKMLVGNTQSAEIFEINCPKESLDLKEVIQPQIFAKVFNSTILNAQKVFLHLYNGQDKLPDRQALYAFAAAAEIYTNLPCTTVSTSVLSTPLSDAYWIPQYRPWSEDDTYTCHLSLAEVFACVAMFDSGSINIEPKALSEVFAMSSGNSIYVTSVLLKDPTETPNMVDIRRIVGNIGQAGISFLVPPPEPKTRGLEMDNWMQINHRKFDGKAEDNFQHTTIHLSFTDYEMPLKVQRKDRHTIDRPARLVETLLSVHDRGRWIADLNFLDALAYSSDSTEIDMRNKFPNITRLKCHVECSHKTFEETIQKLKASCWARYMLQRTLTIGTSC